MDCREWLSKDGFLSFYHKDHPSHGSPFSDTIDSTAIWLLQAWLNDSMPRKEIVEILLDGFSRRATDDGGFVRYPGADTPIKRDQLDFMVPLLRLAGLGGIADTLIKRYGGILLPHHKNHLYNEDSWFGIKFEEFDCWFDRFNESIPSKLNNVSRLVYSSVQGYRMERAIRIFKETCDPWYIMVIYGARTPETEAGKKGEELKRIREKVFRYAMEFGPGINTPPPIYLGWDKVMENYL